MKAEKWRIAEITFRAEELPANPVTGADVRAVFTHESGSRYVINGFWNGDKEYAFRFRGNKCGKWTYRVSAEPQSLGFDGAGGELTVVPYTGDLPMYRHGFLKKGPKGRCLSHDDGTPFFWLGDTHWSFVTSESWDSSNCDRYESQFRGTVDKRVSQGFTVYQCNLHCSFGESRKFSFREKFEYFDRTENGYIPKMSVFKDNMDLKMNYLADHGLLIALGFAWYANITDDNAQENYKMLTKYLTARYGAYPIVWTLAGEIAGYTGDMRQTYIDGWREIALEIEKQDGFNSLQSCHYTNERPLANYYQDESWFDFTLNQCGHADLPINAKVYRDHITKYPMTPFVEGEALYDGLIGIEDMERVQVNARMVRLAAYTAMQSGACGYTYGAQGCWNAQWDKPDPNDKKAFTYWGALPWYEGIEREGANSLTIMKRFYESVNWAGLSPMYECCKIHNAETSEQFLTRATPPVLADTETKTVVAFYKMNAKDALLLKGLGQPYYKMQWFDPENGHYTLIEERAETVNGALEIPAKPGLNDWVLLLTAAE